MYQNSFRICAAHIECVRKGIVTLYLVKRGVNQGDAHFSNEILDDLNLV